MKIDIDVSTQIYITPTSAEVLEKGRDTNPLKIF